MFKEERFSIVLGSPVSYPLVVSSIGKSLSFSNKRTVVNFKSDIKQLYIEDTDDMYGIDSIDSVVEYDCYD